MKFRFGKTAAVVVVGALGMAACAPNLPPLPDSPITFTKHVVDGNNARAAFTIAADVLAGQGKELVTTSFQNSSGGPGTVSIYQRQGSGLDNWTRTEVVGVADGIKFPNEVTVADINGDGRQDMIVPGGFFTCTFFGAPACGSLQWFEQPVSGPWIRHQIVPLGADRFYHRGVLEDVDGDGILDMVTNGETANDALMEWFKGTASGDRFETTARPIGYGGGSLPIVRDVDGDGDTDVVSGQLFDTSGAYIWFERTAEPSLANPNGVWVRHLLDGYLGQGFSITAVPNLRGDSVTRYVGTNHVNITAAGGGAEEGVYEFTPGVDPTQPWAAQLRSQGIRSGTGKPGQLAPGYFGYGDIDGDGDIDLAVSGDGDTRLFWMAQQPDHSFQTYVIDTNKGQAGGAVIDDFDGDGHADIVFSSYDDNSVLIYSAN